MVAALVRAKESLARVQPRVLPWDTSAYRLGTLSCTGTLHNPSADEVSPVAPRPATPHEPVLHGYWGAGISFSRGHRAVSVPYDCCTPHLSWAGRTESGGQGRRTLFLF